METNGFKCQRCGFEYPLAVKVGEMCRWCECEKECCVGGVIA